MAEKLKTFTTRRSRSRSRSTSHSRDLYSRSRSRSPTPSKSISRSHSPSPDRISPTPPKTVEKETEKSTPLEGPVDDAWYLGVELVEEDLSDNECSDYDEEDVLQQEGVVETNGVFIFNQY